MLGFLQNGGRGERGDFVLVIFGIIAGILGFLFPGINVDEL